MKVYKVLVMLLLVTVAFVGCNTADKKEDKKQVVELAAKPETFSLNVSGMTCEMGCAKTIESKLAKKAGVLDAKVVFSDSIATIKYDTNKLNKKQLMAFVETIGAYKVSEAILK